MEKKTILLVEDDGVIKNLIKEVLESKYNILAVSNCQEAIKQIDSSLDLALIDYLLPDGDGFDVLKALRAAKPGLPVIMITAYSTEALAIKALRSGVTDYLKKPFSLADLMGRLSDLLEGKRNVDEPECIGSREMFIMDCIAAFIENNYTKDITRDELAKRACMDKYKFSKEFTKMFGRGVRSYLNAIRTREAAALLRNGKLNVAEVAFSVGYGSVPHFCRVFKETYGLPPVEYRKRVHSISN